MSHLWQMGPLSLPVPTALHLSKLPQALRSTLAQGRRPEGPVLLSGSPLGSCSLLLGSLSCF